MTNKERISFFPEESLEQEVVDALMSASIDGDFSRDIPLEDRRKLSYRLTQEEIDEFLIECGIDPKLF